MPIANLSNNKMKQPMQFEIRRKKRLTILCLNSVIIIQIAGKAPAEAFFLITDSTATTTAAPQRQTHILKLTLNVYFHRNTVWQYSYT